MINDAPLVCLKCTVGSHINALRMVRENDVTVYNLVSESDASLHDLYFIIRQNTITSHFFTSFVRIRGCCLNSGKEITIQTDSGYLLSCKIKEEMIFCDKCRDQSC